MTPLPTSWSELLNYTDVLVGRKQLLGTLAHWSVRQSPYPCPDNLHIVLQKLEVMWLNGKSGVDGEFVHISTMRDLESWLHQALGRMPEFLAWNERKNGDRSAFGFTSRYWGRPDPDADFIDLHALVRNVAMDVWRESVHNSLQRY